MIGKGNMAKVITSEAYTLIRQDLERVGRNALLFFLPAATIILEQMLAGKTVEEMYPILKVWLLGTLLDLVRKMMARTDYKGL